MERTVRLQKGHRLKGRHNGHCLIFVLTVLLLVRELVAKTRSVEATAVAVANIDATNATDRLASIWTAVYEAEEKIHVANLLPTSGPVNGGTVVTLSGIGFQSALEELEKFLVVEQFEFTGNRSEAAQTIPPKSYTRSVPQFFLDSITSDANRTMSSLAKPSLVVHIDVIDGLYVVATPDNSTDSSLSFRFPILPKLSLLSAVRPTERLVSETARRLEARTSTESSNFHSFSKPQLTSPAAAVEQRLALISVHLFPYAIFSDRNPLMFKVYTPPQVTSISPSTLTLAGGENVYLYGTNLFASDVIRVQFSTDDRSKITDCEFVMTVPATRTPPSDLADSDVVKEVPAILCSSPPWVDEQLVSIAVSLNGQQFHRALSPDTGEPLQIAYRDTSSLLGAVAKGVIQRDRDAPNGPAAAVSSQRPQAGDKPDQDVVHVVPPASDQQPSQILRVVEEDVSNIRLSRSGADMEHLVASNGKGKVEAASPDHPKHLPTYREKPKDLLTIHFEDEENNMYVLSQPGDLSQLRYDARLLADITFMVVAVATGGFVAEILRMPSILGHLVSGMIVGPQVWNRIQQPVQISSVSQLGSALLLFDLGIHFSLTKIMKVGTAACWGGLMPPVFFVSIFVILALAQGTSVSEGVVFGCLMTMSSTVLCSRDIAVRKAVDAHESDVAIGILLVQDVLLGLLIAFLPLLEPSNISSRFGRLLSVFLPIVNVGAIICIALFALMVLPHFLSVIHQHRSHEVFFLLSLVIPLGLGYFSERLGLSVELGAFAAGLIVGRLTSKSRNHIANVMEGLRDFFAALFFASIGLTLDPYFVWDNFFELMGVLLIGVTVKFLVYMMIARYDFLTSVRVGISLSHLGEFGFVILSKAARLGLLGRKVHLLLIGTTGMSLVVTPLVLPLLSVIQTGRNMYHPPLEPAVIDLSRACSCWANTPVNKALSLPFVRSFRSWISRMIPADYFPVPAVDPLETHDPLRSPPVTSYSGVSNTSKTNAFEVANELSDYSDVLHHRDVKSGVANEGQHTSV